MARGGPDSGIPLTAPPREGVASPAAPGDGSGDRHHPRPRRPADLDECLRLAERVRAVDGYPPYLPDGNLRRFLLSADVLAAWVVDQGVHIVGHVALHARSSEPVMALARAQLSVCDDRIGVIARLLVDPDERRRGIGSCLLDVAAAEARRRQRHPVLDVATQLGAARQLYEAHRWVRLGSVVLELDDGGRLDEHVYTEGPRANRPRANGQ